MASQRYEYLKLCVHWFAMKYHWGWREVYGMPVNVREDYFRILQEQVEAENNEYD
nr:MAG TPA: hypothetical protein [Caudoviricetes sp.]